MTDATSAFFHQLEARAHEPALARVTGTLRFDIVQEHPQTARWLVRVKRGEIAVAHENGEADCVVCVDKALFDGIAQGHVNAFAALLRGALKVEGDIALLALFQRLFPEPPRRRAGTGTTRSRGRPPPRGSGASVRSASVGNGRDDG
jgi:SCP-2 sterol transfer family